MSFRYPQAATPRLSSLIAFSSLAKSHLLCLHHQRTSTQTRDRWPPRVPTVTSQRWEGQHQEGAQSPAPGPWGTQTHPPAESPTASIHSPLHQAQLLPALISPRDKTPQPPPEAVEISHEAPKQRAQDDYNYFFFAATCLLCAKNYTTAYSTHL